MPDKILCDKGFNIAKNPKFDGYQRCLASMFFILFFYKKSCGSRTSGGAVKSEIVQKKELVEELHKPITSC